MYTQVSQLPVLSHSNELPGTETGGGCQSRHQPGCKGHGEGIDALSIVVTFVSLSLVVENKWRRDQDEEEAGKDIAL